MNKTPIHRILQDDDDLAKRLERLERILLANQQQQQQIYQRKLPSRYEMNNVVKGQADCVGCATRTRTTEKIMYFSLGVVLTTMMTLLMRRNMKNNQQSRR